MRTNITKHASGREGRNEIVRWTGIALLAWIQKLLLCQFLKHRTACGHSSTLISETSTPNYEPDVGRTMPPAPISHQSPKSTRAGAAPATLAILMMPHPQPGSHALTSTSAQRLIRRLCTTATYLPSPSAMCERMHVCAFSGISRERVVVPSRERSAESRYLR